MKRLGVSLLLLVMCLSIILPTCINVSAEENNGVVQYSETEITSGDEIVPMSGGCSNWIYDYTHYLGCTDYNCPGGYATKEVEVVYYIKHCVSPSGEYYDLHKSVEKNLGCNCIN